MDELLFIDRVNKWMEVNRAQDNTFLFVKMSINVTFVFEDARHLSALQDSNQKTAMNLSLGQHLLC